MKLIVGFFLLAIAANTVYGDTKCGAVDMHTKWIDLWGDCLRAMRRQIQTEVDVYYTYLIMGEHFSGDTINLPGFAELFFNLAKEESERGQKLIEYLLMRGYLSEDVTGFIHVPTVKNQHDWTDGASALENALNLGTKVTESIRDVIQTCDKRRNYYHLIYYLTGDYLKEQLKGQYKLAGKLSTLKKMMINHNALNEFLFDKHL